MSVLHLLKRLRRRYTGALLGAALGAAAVPGVSEVATFTDSRGRTTLFEYSLKDEWDAMAPRGVLIYFHGHSIGSQEDMLRWHFPSTRSLAYAHDLIPVTVASPESNARSDEGRLDHLEWYKAAPHTGPGRRNWTEEDERLIQELLQSHFGGRVRVDFDRVVFVGGSQGTCFLNDFVQRFGQDYGGGFLARCGCIGEADPLWRPPAGARAPFRVFVSATTEDFLHRDSVSAYGYYKHVVGLQTYGDLGRAGGHCAAGDVSDEDAVRWLLHGTGLPEPPAEPHLRRVALMEGVQGFTVDDGGALWIATQPTPASPATVWRSVDRGRTLESVSRVPLDSVMDLDAAGEALFLTTFEDRRQRISYHRSSTQGTRFERLPLDAGSAWRPGAVTDRDGRIYVMTGTGVSGGPDVYRSDDLGESWTSLGARAPRNFELIFDPVVADGPDGYLLLRGSFHGPVEWIGSTRGHDWRRVEPPSRGRVVSAAWDGATLWGLVGRGPGAFHARLYASFDHGVTWEPREMPAAATLETGDGYGIPDIAALREGELLIIGGQYDGFLFDGTRWTQILGGRPLGRGGTIGRGGLNRHIAIDLLRGDVFVSDGRGMFRIDGGIRGFGDPDAALDADADGIVDALDVFPDDPAEFLDTDADGVGNAADPDDDGDGVADDADEVPLDAFETRDTDRDGVGDRQDADDDGDGVRDVVDAFPLDRREQADTDGDGIGDWADEDDDGDGVVDTEDAFPLRAQEWSDADRDGIGDNIDADDDNDGIPDEEDTILDPTEATAFLEPADSGLLNRQGVRWQRREVRLSSERPGAFIYPSTIGSRQHYGHVTLGDGPDPYIQLMVDYVDDLWLVYVDRNDNGDLTDDGAPVTADGFLSPTVSVDVTYSSGLTVPYRLPYGTLSYDIPFGGAWIGEAAFRGGTVGVLTVDRDIDGIYDGPEDYVCIDVNRDRWLACRGNDPEELFGAGESFQLDGRTAYAHVAVSGHRLEIRTSHEVPMFPSASHPTRQGFVRVTNRSDRDGSVTIRAFDDAGTSYGPVSLSIDALETAPFNSDDLEFGNPDKGLPTGLGAGTGTWRLELESDLDIEVLSYIRTTDGFVTSMHDFAPVEDRVHRVAFFNPGSNSAQVSALRLVNAGRQEAAVSIQGTDDAGRPSPTTVGLTIPPFATRTLPASDLESGMSLTGALGDGTGKWRLRVTADRDIRVMSLLESPTGHLTNLSTATGAGAPTHSVPVFPQSSHPTRQGFVRVVNRTDRDGTVTIHAFDDEGASHGPLSLSLDPRETAPFNSDDLESGNPDKGLPTGVGPGAGTWRLELESDLDIEVLSYIRTTDGFVTSMHDLVPGEDRVYRAAFFNPGSNTDQVSRLRIVNPGATDASVAIEGIDDRGVSPGPGVQITVPAHHSRNLSAQDLETGGDELDGNLGDGAGKWRLVVTSDQPLQVLSLLESPTGHLTNLSTAPGP